MTVSTRMQKYTQPKGDLCQTVDVEMTLVLYVLQPQYPPALSNLELENRQGVYSALAPHTGKTSDVAGSKLELSWH